MKHVTFLIADGVINPSCLFSAIEVFEKANDFHQTIDQEPYYRIRLAGTTLKQQIADSLFSLQVAPLDEPDEADEPDDTAAASELIILPSFSEEDDFAIRKSRDLIDYIVRRYRKGAQVASLCTGTFLLAATGLLEGKVCATHWQAEAHFRKLFPELDLQPSKIVTDQQGVKTATDRYRP